MREFREGSNNRMMLGPFVDSSGVAITGLTIANTEIQIAKPDESTPYNDATFTSKNSGGATHVAAGYYVATFDSTDCDAAGPMTIYVLDGTTAHMPVRHDVMVLTANNYDSKYGSDYLQVDTLQVSGSTNAGTYLSAAALGIVVGNSVTGTLSTTACTTDLTEATNDHYNGRMIVWTSGVLAGQASEITDYDGATKTLTYNTVTDSPGNGDDFVIV